MPGFSCIPCNDICLKKINKKNGIRALHLDH